jgi:flagellar biosynthesis protein
LTSDPHDGRSPAAAGGAALEVAALGYDRGSAAAPRLLGRGKGACAARILQTAQEHGIPIERDPDLLQCLGALEVGADNPVEAYQAVAQILAFLYAQNEARPG